MSSTLKTQASVVPKRAPIALNGGVLSNGLFRPIPGFNVNNVPVVRLPDAPSDAPETRDPELNSDSDSDN